MFGVPMPDTDGQEIINLLNDLVAKAKKAGADAADAVAVAGTSLAHTRRLGKTEKLERSESQDLGLRVFVGKQQAMVSSSDRAPSPPRVRRARRGSPARRRSTPPSPAVC